jgi:hypothetical protein
VDGSDSLDEARRRSAESARWLDEYELERVAPEVQRELEVTVASALGDGIPKVFTLLERGRAMTELGQPTGAGVAFAEAARLARKAATREHPDSGAPPRPERNRQRWPLSSMIKALREAGLEEVALDVEERAGLTTRRPASVTVSNETGDVNAQNVVQVGVVHGGIHLAAGAGRHGRKSLNVSVTTSQHDATIYEYEGLHLHPDYEVRIFVEAFTAQAVLLHRLRPVFVRDIRAGGIPRDAGGTEGVRRKLRPLRPVPRPPLRRRHPWPGSALGPCRRRKRRRLPVLRDRERSRILRHPAQPARCTPRHRVAAGAGLVLSGTARNRPHQPRQPPVPVRWLSNIGTVNGTETSPAGSARTARSAHPRPPGRRLRPSEPERRPRLVVGEGAQLERGAGR